jgi:hypothetical protein
VQESVALKVRPQDAGEFYAILSREQNIPQNVVNSVAYSYIHDSKLDVCVTVGEGKILKVTTLPSKETSLKIWRHFCIIPVEETHYTLCLHCAFCL